MTKQLRLAVGGPLGGMMLLAASIGPVAAAQPGFPTAEAALAAFRQAAGAADGQAILQLLGPEHAAEIVGGDPAARRVDLLQLQRAVAAGAILIPDDAGRMIVTIGRQAWPLPVPLVQEAGVWRFDTAAGLEEIRDRRIGRNELAVLDVMSSYAEWQRAYAAADHDGDKVREFAQRLISTPGARDGLYWEDDATAGPSPVGPFLAAAGPVAAARQAGEPFYGYHFEILTRQGSNAPGGAYDYVINSHMIAGFALLAWPADYGNSGVMIFLVSHHGDILEKDLGQDTAKLAAAIDSFDPDESWAPVESAQN